MEDYEIYTIVAKWEVEDGYAGRSRPQRTTIKPSDDMSLEEWNGMEHDEKEAYISDAVQTDYESKTTFYIDDYGI